MTPQQRLDAAFLAIGRSIAEALSAAADLIAERLEGGQTGVLPPWTEDKRLMNTAEAAEFLGVSTAMLERDRSVGLRRIPFIKIGRAVRYDRHALEEKISGGEFIFSKAP